MLMGRSWVSRIDWRKRGGSVHGNTKSKEAVQSRGGNKQRGAGDSLHLKPGGGGEAGQTQGACVACLMGFIFS